MHQMLLLVGIVSIFFSQNTLAQTVTDSIPRGCLEAAASYVGKKINGNEYNLMIEQLNSAYEVKLNSLVAQGKTGSASQNPLVNERNRLLSKCPTIEWKVGFFQRSTASSGSQRTNIYSPGGSR